MRRNFRSRHSNPECLQQRESDRVCPALLEKRDRRCNRWRLTGGTSDPTLIGSLLLCFLCCHSPRDHYQISRARIVQPQGRSRWSNSLHEPLLRAPRLHLPVRRHCSRYGHDRCRSPPNPSPQFSNQGFLRMWSPNHRPNTNTLNNNLPHPHLQCHRSICSRCI